MNTKTPPSRDEGMKKPETPGPSSPVRLANLENVDPDSPTSVLASVLSSPSVLLKRPFETLSTSSTEETPFRIKRRKRSMDQSVTMRDVQEANENSGASPSLANSGETSARRRQPAVLTENPSASNANTTPPTFRRSISLGVMPTMPKSFSQVKANDNLTGDFNQSMLLPLLTTGLRHQDLKTIDCHTLANLINGKYDDKVEKYRIIDARYCYEYEGGHIVGAENFGSWALQKFFDEFFPDNRPVEPVEGNATEDKKRSILIFHCEFSANRGPSLMKELRRRDRQVNNYPILHYPEVYLLHKGYKEFFANYSNLCEPKAYQTMSDPNFSQEELLFHKKSKTWGGGTVSRTGAVGRKLTQEY